MKSLIKKKLVIKRYRVQYQQFSSTYRIKRSSADQRIAELQALIALAGSGERQIDKSVVAHGLFDPEEM